MKKVIRLHFFEGKTLREIGREIKTGRSVEAVRQIELRALRIMRLPWRLREAGFLDAMQLETQDADPPKETPATPARLGPCLFHLSEWGIEHLKSNRTHGAHKVGKDYWLWGHIQKCRCGKWFKYTFNTRKSFLMECLGGCRIDGVTPEVFKATEWIARRHYGIPLEDGTPAYQGGIYEYNG